MGKAAVAMCAQRRPIEAEAIWRATVEEQDKGWLGEFRTKSELDATLGKGQWRFVPRFILHQKAKDRVIDDARRGGQNAAAKFTETIFTASVDFLGDR